MRPASVCLGPQWPPAQDPEGAEPLAQTQGLRPGWVSELYVDGPERNDSSGHDVVGGGVGVVSQEDVWPFSTLFIKLKQARQPHKPHVYACMCVCAHVRGDYWAPSPAPSPEMISV